MERSSHRILTLYSSLHDGHNPPNEYLHGRLVPYFEMPKRLHNIKSALETADLIELVEPDMLVSIDDLSQTQDIAMLVYLQYISAHVPSIIRADFEVYNMGNVLDGSEYFYESVFPDRMVRFLMEPSAKMLDRPSFIFDSVCPIGEHTWDAVLGSANLAYVGAQALIDGESAVYAMCRPPGHHAGYDFMGGYCYVNNAAVAANRLKPLGKVAILDIDYHHGNGTQQIFWDDPDVLFVSIHGEPSAEYPHYTGTTEEIGGQDAQGTTLNFPLALGTTEEPQFLDALDQALDAIQQFAPETLIISLGFDTYVDDPISDFHLEIDSYMKIGRRIAAMGLPTLYVQEGGYHVDDLGDMAVSFFRGVLNT